MQRKKETVVLNANDAADLQPVLFLFDKNDHPHTRLVWKYDEEVRHEQMLALRAMQSLRVPLPIATGGVLGKSLRDNVLPHRHSTIFYLTDFSDAYGHVQESAMGEKVEKILGRHARRRDQRDDARRIESYVREGAFLPGVDGLPQGNVTSPLLFNWYMKDADDLLVHAMAMRNIGERATRYLDDLTVSSADPDALDKPFRRVIREIYTTQAPGMEFAHHKSSIRHLDNEHPALTITGLSLYQGRISPSPALLEAASLAMNQAEAKIQSGAPTDLHDLAVMAGYNGVLNLSGESSHSRSRHVRQMGARAEKLIHVLKQHPY